MHSPLVFQQRKRIVHNVDAALELAGFLGVGTCLQDGAGSA